MAQKGFFFDMNDCTGCKCCVVACKDKNDLPIGTFYRKATDYEGNEFPDVWSATISIACNHCDNPACLASCAVGAIVKTEEEGFVLINEELCIGCKSCISACPYTHPMYIEATNKVVKCDGCIQWVRNGMQPACSGACSTRALKFDDSATIKSSYPDATSDIQELPGSSMTTPNFFIIPKPEMAK